MPRVSIIIRARNEEEWLSPTLDAIKSQSFSDHEIVLVDNDSSDNTRAIFQHKVPGGKLVENKLWRPGLAINQGIAASQGELAVVLSAHCVPCNRGWLQSLVDAMDDAAVGAAYGRQLPLPVSHPQDKRDLLNTFGLEARLQKVDTFFHNANSIIRRELWEEFPFDEKALHIEDRLWAAQVIATGKWIAYVPEAAVYHHHGINHHSDLKRAQVISDVLTSQTIAKDLQRPAVLDAASCEVLYCVLGHNQKTHPRLREMVERLPAGKGRSQIFAHSRQAELVDLEGVWVMPRPPEHDSLTFVRILDLMLAQAEERGFFPSCLVYCNLKHEGFFARSIGRLVDVYCRGLYDSVFFAEKEYSNIWIKDENQVYNQLAPDYQPRERKIPFFIARYGLGLATRPRFIRDHSLVGSKVAIIDTNGDRL